MHAMFFFRKPPGGPPAGARRRTRLVALAAAVITGLGTLLTTSNLSTSCNPDAINAALDYYYGLGVRHAGHAARIATAWAGRAGEPR